MGDDHVRKIGDDALDLFNLVCQNNLEGFVARRKTGAYSSVKNDA